MLNPMGNYIYQLADPDINFDWETIEQVVSDFFFFCQWNRAQPTKRTFY